MEEIKPYVAIGPTEELSISVDKDTFDKTFLFLTLIFGISLIVVIGTVIFFAFQQSAFVPAPPLFSNQDVMLHNNVGGVNSKGEQVINRHFVLPVNGSNFTDINSCLSNKNTTWENDRCKCNEPYFGSSCEREKHNVKYFSVGLVNTNRIDINVIETIETRNKSFGDSCSQKCDNNKNCIGFTYENNICKLLKGNVVIPSDVELSYSVSTDSNLYLKSSENLFFKNTVFLGEHMFPMKPRYWLVSETKHYKQIRVEEITRLNFVPTYSKVFGNYTGIYSKFIFTIDDVRILVNRGTTNNSYIQLPGEKLNIPSYWKFNIPIYVLYTNLC